MKNLFWIIFITVFVNGVIAQSHAPRIAIVISKTSFAQHWGVTQMAAHGWGGVANLAGIPYDCLFIEDFNSAKMLEPYDCLVLGQCGYVAKADYKKVMQALDGYLAQGGNLILDGPLAWFDEKARERDHSKPDILLGIENAGFKGNDTYRIKVADARHFVTKSFAEGEFITQHIANGLNIQQFAGAGKALLELTNEQESFPFLSVKESGKNRIVLVNDFSTWASVPSFFRNNQPQVFYPNKIYNALIQALYWSVYGGTGTPVPSLQVSNANLTAIIRLDADVSQNLDAQIRTISYLNEIARETGVVALYAWVASAATKAGWQDLAPLGKALEDLGGQIGTHSRFHHIDREMNEMRWKEELDDAIQEIEFNMSDFGYDIGKVDGFINPGNTIHMDDYGQVAKRFSFYMTHGFEQDMPIGFGNFTWFNENHKNFVVLENTPSPDYQWFYDPTWSYTTQQITAYQENIFDHLFGNIGRGVIYNQMWHDYSITSQPQYGKERIMNKNNIAMYDAVKAKFKTHDIYCPDPGDLQNKLCLMAQGGYDWQVVNDTIDLKIDFSKVALDSAFRYAGGMGVRINNTVKKIHRVFIDGKEYFAFNDQLVILSDLTKPVAEVTVILGCEPTDTPHLTFVSKRLDKIEQQDVDLSISLKTVNKAKYTFAAASDYILLNSDSWERDREGANIIKGYITSDRTVTLKKTQQKSITILRSTIPITGYRDNADSCTFILKQNTRRQKNQFAFSVMKNVPSIMFDDQPIIPVREGNVYTLDINFLKDTGSLTIKFD